MKELMKRFLTAVVLVPPLILIIYLPYPWIFNIFVLISISILSYEYHKLTVNNAFSPLLTIFLIDVGSILFYLPWKLNRMDLFLIYFLFITIIPVLLGVVKALLTPLTPSVAYITLGLVYFPVCGGCVCLLRDIDRYGSDIIIFAFMIAFLADTLAYFFGKKFGRHKLAPSISPGKTWEGSFGGVLGNIVAVLIAHFWFFPELNLVYGAILAIISGVIGQFGDLFESLIKRACGKKDSGNLLPGHGGLWDRVDAFLVIAPVLFLGFRLFYDLMVTN